LQEFAPYRVLEIETVFTARIMAFDYLLLGLSNGMLLTFNLYPVIFGQGLSDAARLQKVKQVGTIQDVIKISFDAALVVCEDVTFIISSYVECGRFDTLLFK